MSDQLAQLKQRSDLLSVDVQTEAEYEQRSGL